jgi:uroporphyrinogen-III synthase
MGARQCLILRTGKAAHDTAARVDALGWDTEVVPSRQVHPMGASVPPGPWQAIVITSAHAIASIEGDTTLKSIPMLTVGDATQGVAEAAGWLDVRSAHGDATALAALVKARLTPGDGPLLYPRGRIVAGDLEQQLKAVGFEVIAPIVYEMVPEASFREAIIAAIFWNEGCVLVHAPSAGRDLAQALDGQDLSGWRAICLSAAVAATVAGLPWDSVAIAARPDEAAMLELL